MEIRVDDLAMIFIRLSTETKPEEVVDTIDYGRVHVDVDAAGDAVGVCSCT